MKTFSILCAFGCSLAAVAAPSVGNVTVSTDAGTGRVSVSYELADGPAIVTLDVLTNGVSIGAQTLADAEGDVNRLVSGNAGTVLLPRDLSLGRVTVVAQVSAWDPTDPPDYMVADLLVPNSVRYYVSTNALPGGLFGNAAFRETKMVFRRIKARGQSFTMGSPTDEISNSYRGSDGRENEHTVNMTKDFWLGVFEVTQAQYLLMKGGCATMGMSRKTENKPFSNCSEEKWTHRPADRQTYNEIRHSATTAGNAAARYPNGPGEGSWLKLMRDRTGLAVDLPGEAQWEYACRAGTGAYCWNTGASWPKNNFWGGAASQFPGCCSDTTGAGGTAPVGSSEPNAWGLYDMHGNVCEACLDWYQVDISSITTDEPNAYGDLMADGTSGSKRVYRGGYWSASRAYCRSASRQYTGAENNVAIYWGFRVMAPIPNPAD